MLSTKPPKEESKVDAATQQEDYYKTFRTNVSFGVGRARSMTDVYLVLLGAFGVDAE